MKTLHTIIAAIVVVAGLGLMTLAVWPASFGVKKDAVIATCTPNSATPFLVPETPWPVCAE